MDGSVESDIYGSSMIINELELRALEIRRSHASELMRRGHLTGQDALAMIVVPSAAVLDASMEAALAAPVVREPHREPVLRAERPTRVVQTRPRHVRRIRPAVMTLDEILAAA